MGLRSKISKDLTRLARIHSGSPLIFDSSAITSRDTPVRALSWPCSSSTMGLGLVIRVLSVAAKTGPFKSPIPELGIVPGGVREKPVTGRKSGASRASKARMRRLTPLLVSLIVLSPADGARADALPPVKHAFVIVLENSDFEDNFPAGTAPQAPYLAKTLTRQGQLLTHYYGTSHVSLGNYLSMVSGQAPNPDTQSDCLPQFRDVFPGVAAPDHGQILGSGCVYPASVQTVADQLEAKGLTWRGYMEDMGDDKARDGRATCSHPAIGTTDGTQSATAEDQYATRHNPFVYFHSILDSPLCHQRVVPLTALQNDLAKVETTASFNLITPNLCNDGHDDPCVGKNVRGTQAGGLVSADYWLQKYVPLIMSSPAFKKDGVLIVTSDESENSD